MPARAKSAKPKLMRAPTTAELKKMPARLSYLAFKNELKKKGLKNVAGNYAAYKVVHGVEKEVAASKGKASRGTTSTKPRSRSRSTTPASRRRSATPSRKQVKQAGELSTWAMAVTLAAAETGEAPPYAKGSRTYRLAQDFKTDPTLTARYLAYRAVNPKTEKSMSEETKAKLARYSKAQSAYAKSHNMTVKAVKEAKKAGRISRADIMKFDK